MEPDINTKYEAAVVVNWLRKCSESANSPWACNGCPFDDGINNCMDQLHSTAADLIVKLAGLKNK